jgi:hypothetical protein
MGAISIQTEGDEFVIRLKKSSINEIFVMELLRRLRMEQLAKEIDFDNSIDSLGEEIKADWWEKNKDKHLTE